MKKQLIICSLLFTVTTSLNAQAPASKKSTATATKTTTAQTTIVDLSSLGINATIKAPAGVKAVAGAYSSSIKDDKDFDITIEATTTTFAATKEALAADKENVIVASSDKAILYTTSMMGRNMAHFECIVTINDVTYRLYDKRVVPLNKEAMMPMYEAAQTITAR